MPQKTTKRNLSPPASRKEPVPKVRQPKCRKADRHTVPSLQHMPVVKMSVKLRKASASANLKYTNPATLACTFDMSPRRRLRHTEEHSCIHIPQTSGEGRRTVLRGQRGEIILSGNTWLLSSFRQRCLCNKIMLR